MTSHRLPFDVNCSILFTELPLLERPAAAKTAGFDAVEFWWPFAEPVPSERDVDAFVTAIGDAGVRLVGLNFFAGDMPAGDRGVLSCPGRVAEFRANADVVAGIGQVTGCRAFNALYGNRVDGEDAERQDDLAAESLAYAAQAVGEHGGVVLVEPVSGVAAYPLRTADDAVAVIDRVAGNGGPGEVRLLADLYHLSVNGVDLDDAIARHTQRVGHVQIADAPGRHEPGTGTLDVDGRLAQLERAGYTGWVGLEYVPTGLTEDSLDWLPRDRRAAGD